MTKRVKLLRELSAEFIATAFMLALGSGSCCAARLSAGQAGNTVTVVVGWGFAVLFAVLISGGISGGHLNPAVSFSFAVAGDLPWSKFFLYSIAQISGAFFGSALTWIVYYDALNTFDGGYRNLLGQNGTADMFATYPQSFLSTSNGLVNEIFATCLLMMCVMAIIDKKNMALPAYLLPLMVGLTIILINCSFCYNSGCAMNPARDFGPRLFTAVAGWGLAPFSFRNWNWFWVPIVGPLIGGPIGTYVYKFFIGFCFCNNKEDKMTSSSRKIEENGTELVDKCTACSRD